MTPPLDDHPEAEPDRFGRRESLIRAGGLAIAVLGAGAVPAAASASSSSAGAVACVLSPEMTEGPYYIANEKVRRNITEGMPGTPLALRLTVVNASTCKPIKGAAVDIWHADAARCLLGRAVERHRRPHVHARDPAHGCDAVSPASTPSTPAGTRVARSTST